MQVYVWGKERDKDRKIERECVCTARWQKKLCPQLIAASRWAFCSCCRLRSSAAVVCFLTACQWLSGSAVQWCSGAALGIIFFGSYCCQCTCCCCCFCCCHGLCCSFLTPTGRKWAKMTKLTDVHKTQCTQTNEHTRTRRAPGIDLVCAVQWPTLWHSAQCPWTGYMCGKYKILHVFDLCWLLTLTQRQQHHHHHRWDLSVCVCVCMGFVVLYYWRGTLTRTYFSTFPSKCPCNVLASKQIIAYTSVVVLTSKMRVFYVLASFPFSAFILNAPGTLNISLAKFSAFCMKFLHKFSKYSAVCHAIPGTLSAIQLSLSLTELPY